MIALAKAGAFLFNWVYGDGTHSGLFYLILVPLPLQAGLLCLCSKFITRSIMRFTWILMFLMVAAVTLRAQEGFKGEHFIEVSGTAQMEVEPNEITVFIRLREFEENKQKTNLEKLDQDFLAALKNAGIDKKRLELYGVGSKLEKLGKKEKDAFREKSYQIKLTGGAELEKFLEKLEPVKVEQVNIIKIHHTELEKLKLDLKIKALQAAKAKADALIKSIGGEIGKTLMVREWEEHVPGPMVANAMYRMEAGAGDMAQEDATSFRKIQLRSQVTAQFEIK